MAKVFISFLGVGFGEPTDAKPGYDKVCYRFEGGALSASTRFAQRAIIEKHGAETFERICLMMTPESKDKHRDLLVDELITIGCKPEQIVEDASITTNQNAEQQWEWFDSLQSLIQEGDQVVFDFTHGFRSVPIIFSTAISFLQKVKRFELLHAYYGYVDKREQKNEIIDMAKFYRINEWADGVSRLVDTADASKLAQLADEGKEDGFSALNDPDLTSALRELTDLIKNIDVNNVGRKADEALALIKAKQAQCTGADAQLLQMVVEKFSQLAIQGSGRYDYDYFRLQLTLAEMLLKHGLNMQAFTVMRECIASIGMMGATGHYASPKKAKDARRYRGNLGEIFWGLCVTQRSQWREENNRQAVPAHKLKCFDNMIFPLYQSLDAKGLFAGISSVAQDVQEIRNGFNHAWTAKAGAAPNISEKGRELQKQLSEMIELLREHQFLN